MDATYFRHQSDSRYCFSLDESHALIRLVVSKLITVDKIQLIYGDPMTFASRHLSLEMEIKHEDASFYYYEAVVNLLPMRLMYIFLIQIEDKNYYFTESGVHDKYLFDLAFISAYQFVGENYNDYVKENETWKGRVIYQIFPERYYSRGDPKKKSYVNMDWSSSDIRNNRNAFIGGDLYGVIDKLEYLSWLGVGAIYFTPIHPSNSNHKYDVKDYFDVDEQFGGKKAFKELVEKVHALDIKIMMDLVFNHVSYYNPIFQDVKEYGRNSPYYNWFFINGDKPSINPLNYRCFGYYAYMPKLNTNNVDVQEYLISVGEYWIKEFGVDGYRLDVSEGVSHDFWNRFKIRMKDIKEDILVVGENWFNSESYLGNNELDSVMNYPFLDVVSRYVQNQNNAEQTAFALDGLQMRYKDGHNRMMMNILSSHDIQRVMNLTHQNKDLSLIAYAIMMFYLGLPLIYYGEEIFMEGGRDPDNRRGMDWNHARFTDPKFFIFRDLILLRKDNVLKAGDIEIGYEKEIFFIRRTYHNIVYTLYVNMSPTNYIVNGSIILSNNNKGNIIYQNGFAVIKSYK